MFFFRISMLPPLTIGAILLFFGRAITNRFVTKDPDRLSPMVREIFCVWTIRACGLLTIVGALEVCIDSPPRGMMKKDESRLLLLAEGDLTKGEVIRSFYQKLAPEGWKVLYKIDVQNPGTGQEKTYWGSAQGPRKYYANLSAGEPLTIIYYPLNPKINCEIKQVLNDPSYRRTFREAGKLDLLNKYRDEYQLEDYTLFEWSRLQGEK